VKRIFIGFLLAGMCFSLRAEDARALADPRNDHKAETVMDQASCLAKDTVIFPKPSITVFAQKTAPDNPIAIGQDEDKRGVDIAVTVTALPGTAIYFNWVRKEVGGDYYSYYEIVQKGMECYPRSGGRRWCYWVEYQCEQAAPETVYRMLKPENTRVWLDPDDKTRAWLRWSGGGIGDPLRFVFPDDWGLGAWTPKGAKKSSSPGTGNEWWTFLYGDPLITILPETNMPLFDEPNVVSGWNGRKILGLWGTFKEARKEGVDQCWIDNNQVQIEGGNDKYANTRGCNVRTLGALPEQVRILWIDFNNIPLDLPGHWYIGMMAQQYPALYAKGTRNERNLRDKFDESSPELGMGPESAGYLGLNSYPTDTYSFSSYIIISTPCYNADPKSCVN
jgi:hypothetical protein